MANTKTTAKSTKKVEEVKNVEEKVIEKGEEKSIDEVSILKQQLEEMKKAMEALIKEKSEASVPSSKIVVRNEEDDVNQDWNVFDGTLVVFLFLYKFGYRRIEFLCIHFYISILSVHSSHCVITV